MAFASGTAKVWPVAPDWSGDMQETLAWATDVNQSSATAATHARSYRMGPRRGFAFEVAASGGRHRVVDMLLAGWRGTWLLPIWPDVQRLAVPLAAGAEEIPCETAGYDFVPGGKALLYSATNTRAAVNDWEVVDIDTVEADHVALSAPTAAARARGARLYPLRRAVVQDGAEAAMRTGEFSRRSLTFDIAEPCDWPALADLPVYLGHPVLNVRPDKSEDTTHAFAGLRESVDFGAALPVVSDLPGIALRVQRDNWKLPGRARCGWHRSLLYLLRGRQRPIWVPSWNADLKVVDWIDSAGLMYIEWAGYTLFGAGKANRRDVCIELTDGAVHYRRVLGASEGAGVNSGTEILALDGSIDGASIAAHSIRQVSIMALSTLASDSAEIRHLTNGVAAATTGWQAVVPDV